MNFTVAIQGFLIAVCLFTSAATQGGAGATKTKAHMPCSNAEADEAINYLARERAHTWNEVYDLYRKFAHCDDGAISEGFSAIIGRLLVDDWKHVSELNAFVRSTPAFESFVTSHIDEMTALSEWRIVQKNVRHHCPPDARDLCKAIDKTISRLKKP